jgi:hypothetical protein
MTPELPAILVGKPDYQLTWLRPAWNDTTISPTQANPAVWQYNYILAVV